MSSNTTNITFAQGNSLAGITAWFARAFDSYVAKRARTDQIQTLEAMTDAELSKLGVRRDQIVQYVFRDLYWI